MGENTCELNRVSVEFKYFTVSDVDLKITASSQRVLTWTSWYSGGICVVGFVHGSSSPEVLTGI